MTMRHRLGLTILLLSLAGCAGYQLGNRALFPAGIDSVYVPMFESSSLRRSLGEMLTEAVIKEIEHRTPYKVVGDPSADTVLIGRITSDAKHLLIQTRRGDPREMEMDLTVQVTWRTQRGDVVREIRPIPIPAECVGISETAELVPEAGQSTATAQMQAIQRLARRIVDLMEKPW
jgi:hypothetical protein